APRRNSGGSGCAVDRRGEAPLDPPYEVCRAPAETKYSLPADEHPASGTPRLAFRRVPMNCRALSVVLFAGLALFPAPGTAQENGAVRQDRVVAGGPKDFLEVRHLVLKGSNEEIGRALAAIA